jgi:hypothetical protein
MDDLTSETRQAVSMEFAVRPAVADIPDEQGRKLNRTIYEFHLLQVRPQATNASDRAIILTDPVSGGYSLLARSGSAFGHLDCNLSQAFVLTNEIIEHLGKEKTQSLLRDMDRTHRNAYLLVGPDAEEFVVGSSGFESLYSGLSPQAVISIKTQAGIRTLARYSGSHAADNIERAPVIIQDADRLEPDLQALANILLERVRNMGNAIDFVGLLLEGDVRVEIDGASGRGQVIYRKTP